MNQDRIAALLSSVVQDFNRFGAGPWLMINNIMAAWIGSKGDLRLILSISSEPSRCTRNSFFSILFILFLYGQYWFCDSVVAL